MYRFLSFSFITLLTLTATLNASEFDTWQSKATEKAEPSIVAIKVGKATKTTGTGVIIHSRGFIVTNQHVVANAKSKLVNVRLSNGTEMTGKVIWEDTVCDLAVVRVQRDDPLPALVFAAEGTYKKGHNVLAIGHPYGYDYSISIGIISYLGRDISLDSGCVLNNMIQTTAPINKGNSGGPLLNEKAELIGINTLLREDSQNIAFAINASTVKQILDTTLGLKVACVRGSNDGAGSVTRAGGTAAQGVTTVPAAN